VLVNVHLDPCNYALIYWAGAISRICLLPWIGPTQIWSKSSYALIKKVAGEFPLNPLQLRPDLLSRSN